MKAIVTQEMPRRTRYLVLKAEGLDFIATWFGSPKCVPPNLTRLYQLLLHAVTMKGTISVQLASKIGYSGTVIKEAVKRRYVGLSSAPEKASKEVLDRIREIIGEPSREMLV